MKRLPIRRLVTLALTAALAGPAASAEIQKGYRPSRPLPQGFLSSSVKMRDIP